MKSTMPAGRPAARKQSKPYSVPRGNKLDVPKAKRQMGPVRGMRTKRGS